MDKLTFKIVVTHILGDKAYGSETIRDWISAQGIAYTILPTENVENPWKVDWFLYKEPHLIECFFNKIKHSIKWRYTV
ncbi:hypothetical protein JZO67_000797 [Enterococcus sp. 665A]|uniref:Transposase n=1 Tax=Candidatus Enterococcus ferrettii TaxID=2815324 RepID=A0ABV0EMQ9_9ENTE